MNQVDIMKPTENRLYDQAGMGGLPQSQPMQTGPMMQGPQAQFDASKFDIDTLTGPAHVILNQIATQQKSNQSMDTAYQAAKQGIGPDDLHGMRIDQAAADESFKIAQQAVNMNEQEFNKFLERLQQEAMNIPQRPEVGQLEAPNLWQAGASILAGFIDPSRRAEYAAIPLQYQQKKQQDDYARSMDAYKGQMDQHNQRMDMLETVGRYKQQRLTMLQRAQQEAEARQDKIKGQYIQGAQRMETIIQKAPSSQLPSLLQKANEYYKGAGMNGMVVSPEEIDVMVKARQAEEEDAGKEKEWKSTVPLVNKLISELDAGTPAARKATAESLKAIVAKFPERFSADFQLRLNDALKTAGDPTSKEQVDAARIKDLGASTNLKNVRAELLPQDFADRHNKAVATISNLESLIATRKASGAAPNTSREERIAANQALTHIESAMKGYTETANNARKRLQAINDYLISDADGKLGYAKKYAAEKKELEDTIAEAQRGHAELQKQSKEVRDYLLGILHAPEDNWGVAGNIGGSAGGHGTRPPNMQGTLNEGEIPPFRPNVETDLKPRGGLGGAIGAIGGMFTGKSKEKKRARYEQLKAKSMRGETMYAPELDEMNKLEAELGLAPKPKKSVKQEYKDRGF